MEKLCIVVVNYNSGSRLRKCVSAVLAQSWPEWECIIVDNASSDDSMAIPELADARFKTLLLAQNTGFAAGNNRAFEISDAQWIVTLNPDAYPEPDWLEQLLAATRRYPNIKVFGCTQLNALLPELLDGAGDCYHAFGIPWRGSYGERALRPFPEGEIFGPCAAAAMYDAKLLHELGGFDEDFFCYCEDVDLAFRLRLRGERAIQIADAIVHHEGSAITGVASYFSLYHSARNRLWTFVKNMPAPLIYLLLPLHIASSLYLLLRIRKSEMFLPQWRGLLEGVRRLREVLPKRRVEQRQRKISNYTLAKSLQWSIRSLRERKHQVQKLH